MTSKGCDDSNNVGIIVTAALGSVVGLLVRSADGIAVEVEGTIVGFVVGVVAKGGGDISENTGAAEGTALGSQLGLFDGP